MLFHDASSAVGIIDLASTNGTFVNEGRITSTLVSDGDTVSLGGSQLTVRLRTK
jgi:pSer/pThr/pTyr-binding forkhead associated (FHA) protein